MAIRELTEGDLDAVGGGVQCQPCDPYPLPPDMGPNSPPVHVNETVHGK